MADKTPTEITISNRTIVRLIIITIATFVGIRFFLSVTNILVLIAIAAFLALALNPTVSWIVKKLRLKSRVTGTAIAFLMVIAGLVLFVSNILPPLVSQTADFISDLPQTLQSLESDDSAAGRFVQRYGLEEQIDGLQSDLQARTSDLRAPVVATAGRVGSALVSIITVLVLTFMMLVEGHKWLDKYYRLLPKKRRDHHKMLAQKMYRVVTGYVNGQLLVALIASFFAFMVLLISSTLLDVSVNAVALAGVLLFTGLIPMIGNTIGGVLVTLACLFVSVPLALIFAVFFIVYQQIENVSLQPYIQSKYNELTPLLVFVAALLGIGFGGFLGALVAIPVAGCAKILVLDYLERKGRL